MIFRKNEIIFCEIIFRFYEIIFRFNEILFRKNEILFRKIEILFRKNEIIISYTRNNCTSLSIQKGRVALICIIDKW